MAGFDTSLYYAKFPHVLTWDLLPPASEHNDEIWVVLTTTYTGIWPLRTYYYKGFYYCDGNSYSLLPDLDEIVIDSTTLTGLTGVLVGSGGYVTTLGYTPYPDTNPAGYITEAPSDGEQYTRKNGDWAQMLRPCLIWDSTVPFSSFYVDNLSQFNQPVWVMLRGDGFQVDAGEYYKCNHLYLVGEKGERDPQNIYCDTGVNFVSGLPNLYLNVALINNSEEAWPYTVVAEPAPPVWYVGHGCVVGDRRKSVVRFRRNTQTVFSVETRGRLTENCFFDQTSSDLSGENASLTISVFDGARIEEAFYSTNTNSILNYQLYAPVYIAYPTNPAFSYNIIFDNASKNLYFDRTGSSLSAENVEDAIKEVSGSIVTNHSTLSGLAYEYSGHTGFASQGFAVAMAVSLG